MAASRGIIDVLQNLIALKGSHHPVFKRRNDVTQKKNKKKKICCRPHKKLFPFIVHFFGRRVPAKSI
jgi:hypothetical protein